MPIILALKKKENLVFSVILYYIATSRQSALYNETFS